MAPLPDLGSSSLRKFLCRCEKAGKLNLGQIRKVKTDGSATVEATRFNSSRTQRKKYWCKTVRLFQPASSRELEDSTLAAAAGKVSLPQPTNSLSGLRGLSPSQSSCKHINTSPKRLLVLACHHRYYPTENPFIPLSCILLESLLMAKAAQSEKRGGFSASKKGSSAHCIASKMLSCPMRKQTKKQLLYRNF